MAPGLPRRAGAAVFITTLAVGFAGAAAAETKSSRGPVLILNRATPWARDAGTMVPLGGWEAPVRRAGVSVPIRDGVDLVAIGGKELTPSVVHGAQRERSAGSWAGCAAGPPHEVVKSAQAAAPPPG